MIWMKRVQERWSLRLKRWLRNRGEETRFEAAGKFEKRGLLLAMRRLLSYSWRIRESSNLRLFLRTPQCIVRRVPKVAG